MLTALKAFLKMIFTPMLYGGMFITAIATIFKKVEWGFLLMIVMIPQPNLWFKLHEYPMGKDFMDILFFSILFGILYQYKAFEMTSNTTIIIILITISYVALWNSSMRFSLPLPVSTSNELLKDWKNYAEMIALYFLALNVIRNEDQQKKIVLLMTIIILLIAVRSYRNFSAGDSFRYDKRVGGPFEAVGLGANHFGAFIAYYSAFFLGLSFLDPNRKRKLLYGVTVLFGLHPLFFSYSRGAYLAAFCVLIFYGVFKKKSLLVLSIIILVAWHTILPPSVVDRISMTETASGEIEASASHRLDLWEHANQLFEENPIFGVGFGGFGLTVPQGELTDTHNFYMKTLSEQGIIGFIILILIILKAFLSGWRLHKTGKSLFNRGLGLGFMGAVIAVMISNIFGDRWSYFALGGYFWILWGIVDRGVLISHSANMPEVERLS